jgi:hypothetical protein
LRASAGRPGIVKPGGVLRVRAVVASRVASVCVPEWSVQDACARVQRLNARSFCTGLSIRFQNSLSDTKAVSSANYKFGTPIRRPPGLPACPDKFPGRPSIITRKVTDVAIAHLQRRSEQHIGLRRRPVVPAILAGTRRRRHQRRRGRRQQRQRRPPQECITARRKRRAGGPCAAIHAR